MSRSEVSSGSAVAAFVFGTLAGVAAGMLLAPKSGKENREEIKRRAQAGKEKVQEKAEDVKDTAQSKLENGKETAKSKMGKAVDTAKVVANESKNAAKDARDRVNEETS